MWIFRNFDCRFVWILIDQSVRKEVLEPFQTVNVKKVINWTIFIGTVDHGTWTIHEEIILVDPLNYVHLSTFGMVPSVRKFFVQMTELYYIHIVQRIMSEKRHASTVHPVKIIQSKNHIVTAPMIKTTPTQFAMNVVQRIVSDIDFCCEIRMNTSKIAYSQPISKWNLKHALEDHVRLVGSVTIIQIAL